MFLVEYRSYILVKYRLPQGTIRYKKNSPDHILNQVSSLTRDGILRTLKFHRPIWERMEDYDEFIC